MGALFARGGDFLEVEEAFVPSVVYEKGSVVATITLAKEIYLYADKIALTTTTKGVKLNYTLPKAQEHEGIDGMELVYFDALRIEAVVESSAPLSSIDVVLAYQGCSEAGLCYPPVEQKFTLAVGDAPMVKTATTTAEPVEAVDEYQAIFDQGFLSVIALFFGFGVLLALTPCVFPMIPILSSIIVKQGENITTKRAFILSLVYVLAMAVAYTIAGVLAGLFGANLQAALQAPWVIITFSLIFVALAFSMFGFFELRMPQFIQNRVTQTSQNSEGKGIVGVAVMGFLSALIVGPCVAAPMAGALIFIGNTGDAFLGGAALFAMSLGMGLPLLAVGVGAGKFMPKPGGWMEKVTAAFGVVMLGVAIWLLDRIVDESVTLMLYAFLLIISSVYIGAFNGISALSGWGHFTKGAGIIILALGITYFVGALTGGSLFDPLRSLKPQVALSSAQATPKGGLVFTHTVDSIEALDALIAANKGKKMMLDFTAKWCISCKEFEEITFRDSNVIAALEGTMLVKVDVTSTTPQNSALAKKMRVVGPPAMRFIDANGQEATALRINGFTPPDAFLERLKGW
ncbi:MAG: hypothetical protein KU37_08370 [Sulfuricurvum sp. PC08-66]|nr:MAG: hypothetical protein KU37_08370 [Sulfuricurvum sp. PC08-66]